MKLLTKYRKALEHETVAGIVLVIGAVLALVWANSPIREWYFALAEAEVGPSALGLHQPLETWAADGLLAFFFFLVGMELKEEFTIGSLQNPRKALVPMLAAVFGMAGPSLVYLAVQLISGSGIYDGWAVPVATDIAFALSVLGLVGKGLPPAVRTFLMTLAIVDDLLGIIIIAIFFSDGLNFGFLAAAMALIALFWALLRRRYTHWLLLWPIGLLTWYFMFRSGVHATISAVGLGLVVPTLVKDGEIEPLTDTITRKFSFFSAGFVLPVFAFFAAGVSVVDSGGIGSMLTDPVSMGIYLGLPFGKFLGITGGVILLVKIFRLQLDDDVAIVDIIGISLISGIGFTVSLLIATLSFPAGSSHGEHARVAVLIGTLLSVILGGIVIRIRANYRIRTGLAAKDQMTMDEQDLLDGPDPAGTA
ncbi:MAG: Na+/H+ antiporter NhaA [Trueperella sp.]|nr:Na+/H+ antiporter NhaA [Trueperella sp.]